MIFERLVPGMKDGDNSKSPAQTAFAKLQQRFTDGFKQKTQDDLFVSENQSVKFMGQSEDQMKVSHRQKLSGLFFQPPSFRQRLALGTVAVTAGVISRALKAARVAAIQVPAQFLGPADRNGPHHFVLRGRDPMRLLIALPVVAKDVGQLGARSFLSCRQRSGQRHGDCPVKAGRRADRASPRGWWWLRAWAGESASSAGYSEASYGPTAS